MSGKRRHLFVSQTSASLAIEQQDVQGKEETFIHSNILTDEKWRLRMLNLLNQVCSDSYLLKNI